MLKIITGSACIVLTIILLILLLPQTIFPNVNYYAKLSVESTCYDFVYVEASSFSVGFRFRNHGRYVADTYVFFANLYDKYLPIRTTAHIFDTNIRNSIESFLVNEYRSETLRLEGRLTMHSLHVQNAIDEFISVINPNSIIFPYTLQITTIQRTWGDIIVGLLLLIAPSIFGVSLIIATIRRSNQGQSYFISTF